jgi:hypothetical protein
MVTKFILIFILLAFLLTGCNLASPALTPTPISTEAPTLEFNQPTPVQLASPTSTPNISPSATPLSVIQTVLDRAAQVIRALEDKDMVTLAQYVHPQMGVRFSPYAYVKDTDQFFPADKIPGLMADSTIYTWGVYDGSGEPIELTYADYHSKFVYDVDFANAPQLAINLRIGVGNSIDNSQEYYPGARIVEYYFPGFDPQYAGMDWRSIRLVFMEENNIWYLVGIIHDQWTI